MRSLYKITSDKTKKRNILEKTEQFSILYHDIFDFPLTFSDIIKWRPSDNLFSINRNIPILCLNDFYFLKGREYLVYKRALHTRISAKKMEIAKKAGKVLSMIPSVKMVAVTGSLAMNNASDESDVDLLIITAKDSLWTTRFMSYMLLKIFSFDVRKFGDKKQKNKLCLNMWMDETDIVWKKKNRNLYTAHEIAQIRPLINKNRTYEKFLRKNKWMLEFWPNSVKIPNCKYQITNKSKITNFLPFKYLDILWNLVLGFWNFVVFKMQYFYMQNKITRELVTPTRAIFHPNDIGKTILTRLHSLD